MIGPATYGVGGAVGSSLLSRLIDPLDLPRRSLWNAIDAARGGQTAGRPVFIPPGGRPDDATASREGQWGKATESKGVLGMLPALAGIGVGGLTSILGSPALGVPLGLVTAGALQGLGESSTDSEKFQAPETLAGEDPGSVTNTLLKIGTDPMNLLGITAAAKGPGLMAKIAGREAPSLAGAAERLPGMIEREAMNANPIMGRLGAGGFGSATRAGAFPSVLEATGPGAVERSIAEAVAPAAESRLPQIRSRLLEMLQDKEVAERLASSRNPLLAAQTMPDIGLPLPIQRAATTHIPTRGQAEGYLRRFGG